MTPVHLKISYTLSLSRLHHLAFFICPLLLPSPIPRTANKHVVAIVTVIAAVAEVALAAEHAAT